MDWVSDQKNELVFLNSTDHETITGRSANLFEYEEPKVYFINLNCCEIYKNSECHVRISISIRILLTGMAVSQLGLTVTW